MKILGIILAILGIVKFSMVRRVNKDEISERLPYMNSDMIYEVARGYLTFEGLLEALCGAFIVFL